MLGSSVAGVTRRVDAEGTVDLDVTIKASIRPYAGVVEGQPTRCTAATPCRIVIAAAADTQRSAVIEYSVPA